MTKRRIYFSSPAREAGVFVFPWRKCSADCADSTQAVTIEPSSALRARMTMRVGGDATLIPSGATVTFAEVSKRDAKSVGDSCALAANAAAKTSALLNMGCLLDDDVGDG
jgi:hypothetical protein